MKEFVGTMTGQNFHLAAFSPIDVLKHSGPFSSEMPWVVEGRAFWVNMNSQRYRVFSKSLVCSACGIMGTVMMLDVQPSVRHGKAHFNLYAEKDGELILMTKDHILPASKGGSNRLDNYQTMCTVCNGEKKNKIGDFS